MMMRAQKERPPHGGLSKISIGLLIRQREFVPSPSYAMRVNPVCRDPRRRAEARQAKEQRQHLIEWSETDQSPTLVATVRLGPSNHLAKRPVQKHGRAKSPMW